MTADPHLRSRGVRSQKRRSRSISKIESIGFLSSPCAAIQAVSGGVSCPLCSHGTSEGRPVMACGKVLFLLVLRT